MSGPFNHNLNFSGAEQLEQQYGISDGSYRAPYPSMVGPPTHFDGVGFWYRPDQTQDVFDQNNAVFNQNMNATPAAIESTMSIKHRRTRSGCFTCRQRRVKCDETRPTCERCRKGKRQCEFPQPSSSSKRNSKGDSSVTQEQRLSQDVKGQTGQILDTIGSESDEEVEDEDEPISSLPASSRTRHGSILTNTSQNLSRKQKYRQQHGPLTPKERDLFTSGSASPASPDTDVKSTTSARQPVNNSRWKHLNSQLQRYLEFQYDQMTYHHYFFKFDPTNFLHNEFIDLALSFEPLLMAVVAFVAYHHAIQQQDGHFREFWKYYCRSIMLLRKWLEKNSERSEAVILTILQLATFEEYLGDWANLTSHHRAAHSILGSLYTVDTFLATETSRHIFEWFGRVDIIASLMAGTQTVLDRKWFTAAFDFYKEQYVEEKMEISNAIHYFHANMRLIGYDMAKAFANAENSPVFVEEAEAISHRLEQMRLEIQKLHDISQNLGDLVQDDLQEERTGSPGVFDPEVPLFQNELWPLNFVWIDWYGSQQMHMYQTALLSRTRSSSVDSTTTPTDSSANTSMRLPIELEQLSLAQCQIYQAVERWPLAPPGAVLACHASLALSIVFLRREPKFIMWARHKLATIERMGYIWPPTFRKRMAQLWDVEEVHEWWLPDGEGKFKLLEEIRRVVEERNRENLERGVDDGRDDLREMKAIFDRLDIGAKGKHLSISDPGSGSALGSPSEIESSEGASIRLDSPAVPINSGESGQTVQAKSAGPRNQRGSIGHKSSRSSRLERATGI